jgi:hypothetical protein
MQSDILEIRELWSDEVQCAAGILGRGMRDNPNHVQVFGQDPDGRRAALFRMFVPVMPAIHRKGAMLGAFLSGSRVGVCAMMEPGRCQPGILDKIRIIPHVAKGNSTGVLSQFLNWISRDSKRQHWQLGSIAVDAHLQGKGSGSSMMEMFCERWKTSPSMSGSDL